LFCTHGGRSGEKVLAEMEALCGRRARARLSLASRNLATLGHDPELERFVSRVLGDHDAPTTSGAPLSDRGGL
jgi:hypothetical protein